MPFTATELTQFFTNANQTLEQLLAKLADKLA